MPVIDKWACSIDGMMVTGEIPKYWEGNVFHWHFIHHKSHKNWSEIKP